MGGLEGICTALILAELNPDNDGKLDASEKSMFEARGKTVVDGALNYCVNVGVVAALLVSMTYPLCFTVLTGATWLDANTTNSANVNSTNNAAFEILYIFSLQLSLGCSLTLIFVCSRMYVHISFWMPTLTAQLWYVRKQRSILLIMSFLQIAMIMSSAVALFAGTMLTYSWIGFFSLLPLLMCFGVWLCWDVPTAGVCNKYQHHLAKQLVVAQK